MRNASAHKPCSASAQAQGSAGNTHSLRDGDEADADEREQAAAMPASAGSQIQRGYYSMSHSYTLTHIFSLPLSLLSSSASQLPSLFRKKALSVFCLAFPFIYIQIKLTITLSTQASSAQ